MLHRAVFAMIFAAAIMDAIGLEWLQRRMIREINQTHRFQPVSTWLRRLSWRQQREIGEVYRQLFPDNWKADAYTVFWQLNIGLSVLMGTVVLAAAFSFQAPQQ